MDSALLVIDMQNGFVHPEGSLPAIGMGMPNIDKVVAENAAVIEASRAAGVPVIYTRHVYRAGMLDLPNRMVDMLPAGFELLERGSWDADVHDDLAPVAGDVIIDKNRFDAFLYTDLEVQLRALGIKRLLVTGVVTSVCVESTVRSGHQRDFEMYVASDCVSAPVEQHQAALDVMAAIFAKVMPWRDGLPAVLA
ncbi:MAG: hypothetical protein JWN95_3703 [Frankiales bacterium]|nr:hypothetical protein [Frankiales bacterium]